MAPTQTDAPLAGTPPELGANGVALLPTATKCATMSASGTVTAPVVRP